MSYLFDSEHANPSFGRTVLTDCDVATTHLSNNSEDLDMTNPRRRHQTGLDGLARRTARLLAACTLMLLGVSLFVAPASAQNGAIVNGTFDTDLAGWKAYFRTVWDSEDRLDPNSGSAKVVASTSTANTTSIGLDMCLDAVGGVDYDLAFDALIPAGQDRTGSAVVILNWLDGVSCEGTFLGSDRAEMDAVGAWLRTENAFDSPASTQSVLVRPSSFKEEAGGEHVVKFDNISLASDSVTCITNMNTLCLSGGRFAVTADWRTAAGTSGKGETRPLSGDTGTFTFFDPDNTELVVKVLNACSFAPSFFIFAGGLTDVEVVLSVTDTVSEQTEVYVNPLGELYQAVRDNGSFSCP